jgi:hypothetical protein
MGAAGNKQPKKVKSEKHGKHVPSYLTENAKTDDLNDVKKKK